MTASEKLYKQDSINPIDIIENYCNYDTVIQAALDAIDGWGTSQAEELAERLGLQCYSDNTYNHECYHLDRELQFHVLSSEEEWYYDENAIIIIEEHLGGDVRGNYGSAKALKFGKHSSFSNCMSDLFVDVDDIEMED